MTLASSTTRTDALGNGVTVVFPYTFRVFATTELEVIVRNATTGAESVKTYAADYAVSLGPTGGNVTFVTAPANGDVVTIRSIRPLTQPTSIRNGGSFFPETHEDVFDAITRLIQQLQDQVNRSPHLQRSYDPAVVHMELPTPVAGKVLAWNGSASALTYADPTNAFTTVGGLTPLTAPTIVTADKVFGFDTSLGSNRSVTLDVLVGALGRAKREFWAMDSKWGVKADASTDNGAALNACILEAQAVGSGLGPATANVYLTPDETLGGVVLTSQQIVVRKGVRLIGPSERQVILRANSSFPNSTALVRLGHATESNCFGTSVERLALDCNTRTGSIGIYSNSVMEHGGARDVLVFGWMSKGIWLETSGCQNAHFEDIECNIGAGAPAGSRAIHIDATGGRTAFLDVTINGNGAATQGDGLVVTGGALATVFDMHGEHVDNVVRLISGGGTFIAIDGHASVVSVVRYESGAGFRVVGIYKLGATNAVQDIANGVTITADDMDYWVGQPDSFNGWFVRGNKIIGARITGWADPTGTLSRATFDQSTVTLPQLAQRVAQLVLDLKAHGLLGT